MFCLIATTFITKPTAGVASKWNNAILISCFKIYILQMLNNFKKWFGKFYNLFKSAHNKQQNFKQVSAGLL